MRPHHRTDLQVYSCRALLVAAGISSVLHFFLACAAPRWGAGRGLPTLSRPPFVVRLGMMRGGWKEELPAAPKKDFPGGSLSHGTGKAAADGTATRTGVRPPPGDPGVSGPVPASQPLEPAISDQRLTVKEGEGAALGTGGNMTGAGVREAGTGFEESAIAEGRGRSRSEEWGGEGGVEVWEVEEPPEQVTFPEPEYPAHARRLGVEGSVVVRYLVNQQGRVEHAQVLEGPDLLRQASLAAVARFVYRPVRHQGRAVKVWMRQVITFRLE